MRRLRPLGGDYAAFHDGIVENKRGKIKPILRTIEPRLHGSFTNYRINYANDHLEDQVALILTADEVESCLHCYDGHSGKRDELVAAIRLRQERIVRGTCQYCCLGKPNSIDHYLPKAMFPEFSVFALNLIPCCGECNSNKGNYWLDNQERAIINFYRDTPPAEIFLHARLVFSAADDIPVTRFSTDWAKIQDFSLRRRVRQHFTKLGLLPRYEEAAVQGIAQRRITLQHHAKGAGVQIHRENLIKEAKSLRRQFGSNFWQAALCDAMAASPRFLQNIDI